MDWTERLTAPGPKRVLSIDGGGMRGALAVGILSHIERTLREKLGRPHLVLSDYFDLIGGTSTGAIVAAGLALGRDTDNLARLYRELGPKVFRQYMPRLPLVQAAFDPRRLERVIRAELGDVTLGSADWKTGFAAITKRVDTGSVWLLSNNPRSRYWAGDPTEVEAQVDASMRKTVPNRDYPLAKVVQASAAAPFFFDLVPVEVERGRPGVFFDGAITPHGNPALQLAMAALVPAYGFDWSPGADELLIVSVGTGGPKPAQPTWVRGRALAIWKALHGLMSMSYDTSELAIATLQWLGVSPQPWTLNSEVGDYAGASPKGHKPLWSFVRYDAPLQADWLGANLGMQLGPKDMPRLQRMDDDKLVPELDRIGRAAGAAQVSARGFPDAFDLP